MNVKLLIVIFCTLVLAEEGYARKDNKKGQTPDEHDYGDLIDDDDKGGVQNDVDDDDLEEEGVDVPQEHNDLNNEQDAKILSKPQNIRASIGQVGTLPCEVSNKGPVINWNHGTVILYQNKVAMANRPNVKYLDNNSLVIELRNSSDFGEYICTMLVSEFVRPQVVHTITEIVLPTIISLTTENNKTVFSVGDTLTLNCVASGDPTPTISWHKGERLGTTGETLTIEGIRPEDAGTYRCLADNKMGKPAHAVLEIFVKHAPIVSVEKYIVNSNHKSDAELKCTVHGYPAPIVNWQKNGVNVAEVPLKIKLTTHKGNMEKILMIKDLTEENFGIYTCSAMNNMGSDSRNISLVKTPAIRGFQRPQKETKDLTLSWRVESKSPVSEHELQYRKKGDASWRTVKPDQVKQSDNDSYVVKHTLKDLEDGQYETKARSRNEHGWSDFSEIRIFEKAKHGHHKHHLHTKKQHKKEEQKDYQTPAQQQDTEKRTPDQGASTTDSGTSLAASIYVILSLSLLRLLCTSKQ